MGRCVHMCVRLRGKNNSGTYYGVIGYFANFQMRNSNRVCKMRGSRVQRTRKGKLIFFFFNEEFSICVYVKVYIIV